MRQILSPRFNGWIARAILRLGAISGRNTAMALAGLLAFASVAFSQTANDRFVRIATFPVFLNTCDGQPDECINETTVSEIVAASEDGETLVYTDSPGQRIGFVDISDPADPQPAGIMEMGGEPTSVGVSRDYALVAVNTSESFASPSGQLRIVHIPSKSLVRTIELGGQPDAVAVSANRRYAAIAIENERNEDLCVGGALNGEEADEDECVDGGGVLGGLPQLPAGFLVIVDTVGAPSNWATRNVSLTGLAARSPNDPEVEFVDINSYNVAVVTLQENNHIVLVDLATGAIRGHFSAGNAGLTAVDDDDNSLIELNASLSGIPREPDAVAWISPSELATADEGDLVGGSRGFTIFRDNGSIRFTSGNSVEHLAARIGHYPDARSDAKGSEPEGIEYGLYGSQRFLFVGSERSSFIAVYRIPTFGSPELVQVLPATLGPEGLLAIPSRNLFVASSEEDAREDTFRAAITIYQLKASQPTYPTIVSANRSNGSPIPWGALSALSGHPFDPNRAYAIYDSFYEATRIFTLDVSQKPAVIDGEIVLADRSGNALNLDAEGIAARTSGGFWIASEGSGSCAAPGDCADVASRNLLLEVDAFGRVLRQIRLPAEVEGLQLSNGYEGVAVTGSGDSEVVYVAFQREWLDDPSGMVRIGRYEVATGAWTFLYYPLDAPESPNGGWIGLSEIVAVNDSTLAVIERDNQANLDARVKKIYRFPVGGVNAQPQGGVFPVVNKTLVRDVLPDMAAGNGLIIEKLEGLGILANRNVLIVTDNDGTDDSSGETQLIDLGRIL
jgi:hypothetical protein